jgi:hypothetical protein
MLALRQRLAARVDARAASDNAAAAAAADAAWHSGDRPAPAAALTGE